MMSTDLGPLAAPVPPQPGGTDASTRAKGSAANEVKDARDAEPAQTDPVVTDRVANEARALFNKLTSGGMRPYAKLSIEADEKTGEVVYKTIDSRSGEVIRQWPREEILAIAEFYKDTQGLVLDTRA